MNNAPVFNWRSTKIKSLIVQHFIVLSKYLKIGGIKHFIKLLTSVIPNFIRLIILYLILLMLLYTTFGIKWWRFPRRPNALLELFWINPKIINPHSGSETDKLIFVAFLHPSKLLRNTLDHPLQKKLGRPCLQMICFLILLDKDDNIHNHIYTYGFAIYLYLSFSRFPFLPLTEHLLYNKLCLFVFYNMTDIQSKICYSDSLDVMWFLS